MVIDPVFGWVSVSQRQQYGASMRASPMFVAHHFEHLSVTGILPLASTYTAP